MSDNGNKIELSGIFSEGYGIIPKKLMRSKDIGIYEKAVLAYMLSYTGGGNECFPSYERISDELGISKMTVSKSIKRIIATGFIRKEKLYPNDPLKHNNKYILTFLDSTPSVLTTVQQTDSRSKSRVPSQYTTFTSNNNTTNNNSNNNNIKRKALIPPTLTELQTYITDKKYNVDAKYFLEYYTESDWHDANGNKVRNWKQKVITWHGRNKVRPRDNQVRTISDAERIKAKNQKIYEELKWRE